MKLNFYLKKGRVFLGSLSASPPEASSAIRYLPISKSVTSNLLIFALWDNNTKLHECWRDNFQCCSWVACEIISLVSRYNGDFTEADRR